MTSEAQISVSACWPLILTQEQRALRWSWNFESGFKVVSILVVSGGRQSFSAVVQDCGLRLGSVCGYWSRKWWKRVLTWTERWLLSLNIKNEDNVSRLENTKTGSHAAGVAFKFQLAKWKRALGKILLSLLTWESSQRIPLKFRGVIE